MQRKEIWKAHPSITNLLISNQGAVQYKSKRYDPRPHSTWFYHQVRIAGKSYQVHRLVVETFLGPIPFGYVVNHLDGKKSNNTVENLEAVTPEQNAHHARATGLIGPPTYHPSRTARLVSSLIKELEERDRK